MTILYHHRTQAVSVEGVHIRQIIKALRALGHTVDVIAPPGVLVSDPGGPSVPRAPSRRRRLWKAVSAGLPELWFEALELLHSLYAFVRLGTALRAKPYDLVYERYAIFNWAGLAQAKRHRVPFILEVNYTSRTELSRKRSRLLSGLALRIDRRLFRGADGLVVVSGELRRQLLVDFGVKPERIILLPNAADPSVFDPSTVNGEVRRTLGLETKRVIGFVGNFISWQGLDFLVQAMPAILREQPNAVFLFVGDGRQRPEIQARIRQLGLEPHTLFVGEVDHATLLEYIAAFDLAILPHSNTYGSPMKVFEYMAMGKPVVAPRLGPLEDAMTDGEEGLLFAPQDVEGMTRALLRLLTDEGLRRQMGSRARAKIVNERNWMHNARAVLRLHREATADAGSAG